MFCVLCYYRDMLDLLYQDKVLPLSHWLCIMHNHSNLYTGKIHTVVCVHTCVFVVTMCNVLYSLCFDRLEIDIIHSCTSGFHGCLWHVMYARRCSLWCSNQILSCSGKGVSLESGKALHSLGMCLNKNSLRTVTRHCDNPTRTD